MKKPKTTRDEEIQFQLMTQVANALPPGGSERGVTTVSSRPMWQAWCRAVGDPPNCEPTPWQGINTRRVYGSETIVVPCKAMAAVSFATRSF